MLQKLMKNPTPKGEEKDILKEILRDILSHPEDKEGNPIED